MENTIPARLFMGSAIKRSWPLLLSLILVLALTACGGGGETGVAETPEGLPTPVVISEAPPDPGEAAGAFLTALGTGDNTAMYDMLDSESRTGTSIDSFNEIVDGFRSGTGLVGIESNPRSTQIHSPYRASVETDVTLKSSVVGDYPYTTRMDMIREDDIWKVAWDRTVLHPALTEDQKLRAQIFPLERGVIFDNDGTPLAYPGEAAA